MKNVNTSRLGFTLIELLVVVLIIGILAAVALPQYQKAVARSRVIQLQTRLNALVKAAEVYLMDNGQWPHDVRDLDVDITAGAEEFKKSEVTSTDHIAVFWPDGSFCEVHASPAGNKTALCRNKDVQLRVIEGEFGCSGKSELGTQLCLSLNQLK